MARLFVSYSRVDRRFVEALAEKMRRIYGHENVWFDEGLHGGDIWWEEILDQIAARDIFIYVLTNDSVQSPYCQAEFTEARRLQKQIITVQARDRTRLTAELGDIHYVNMAGGVNDGDALTELIRAINKRMTKVPKRKPRPLWEPRTPKPEPVTEQPRPDDASDVDTPTLQIPRIEREQVDATTKRPWRRKTEFVIGAVLIPLIAAVITIFPWLLGQLGSNQPTPMPTTAVAQVATETPTLTGFQQLQTAEAQLTQAKENQAAFDLTATEEQLQSVNASATAQQIAATETAAYATLIALSATPTLSPLDLAQTPVAQNSDWTPVIQEFIGVEMVIVPAGCFMMGSEDGASDEIPVHEVCFEEPFWLDETEVTRAMYQQCVDAGACTAPPASNYSTEPDQPINRVTWFQADFYCQWREARLPTEAEWEYAARGPDGLTYPWGNDFVGDNAVYSSNSGNQTAVVGSKPEGVAWVGALDMSGNVWEWVADWYGDYSGERQVNPQGPDSGQYRVLRGGSFDNTAFNLRAANRLRNVPDFEDDNFGFRCARSF